APKLAHTSALKTGRSPAGQGGAHRMGTALWSRTELPSIGYSPSYPPTQGPRGPGSTQAFFVPRSNPGFQTFLDQTFPEGSPTAFAGYAAILLGRPFALGGNPTDPRGSGFGQAKSDAYRISTGLEKDFTPNFAGSLYGTFIRSERTAFSLDFLGGRLQDALNGFGGPDCTGTTPGENGCLYFNPFINSAPGNPALGLDNPAYVPGLENDPALLDYLRQPSGSNESEEQFIVDLVFNGETELVGLPVGYAFGGQYRKTEFVSRGINRFSNPTQAPCAIEGDFSCLDDPNDNNFPTGPFTFLGQFPTAIFNQSVYALFAEARVNPFDTLEIVGAVRYEDYGDPVGATVNPKVSALFEATDWLSFRGSVGTTFRGPLAADISPAGTSFVEGIDAAGGAFKATDTVGNPELEPETALTYSVGALIDYRGFNFSVDYWTYEFEGRFALLPVQAIASAISNSSVSDGTQAVNCDSPFAQFITFTGGICDANTVANDISRIRTQTVNGPDVTTRGLDFSIGYSRPVAGIDLSFGANATHVLEYSFTDFEYQGLLFDTGYEASGFANYNRDPGTVSPWRASAFVNARMGAFGLSYNFTFIDGVDDNRCPDDGPCTQTPEFGPTDFGRTVDSFSKHDIFANLTVPIARANVRFTAGVENILDEDPSAARLEYSYDPFIGNALGRTYKLGAKVTF
ncbi:TonB-dependent receptor domain-containing protein, partial [Croceicoccus hydrothermalis]|uniref:TonB-dependent receptor domain-containing protein n=1 Tax=Croceicoccus hydrothermalis TaxID=2867964 RepID=UPI001EFA8B6D